MSAIRFHLDEHVATAIAVGLRRRGVDVTTAYGAGLAGADDPAQIQFARLESRVVVTHDRDFIQHHFDGMRHAGIFYCHQDKHTIGDLLSLLVIAHSVLSAEEMFGVLEFL
jgi:uncharacterized protein with PIN domain